MNLRYSSEPGIIIIERKHKKKQSSFVERETDRHAQQSLERKKGNKLHYYRNS